MTMPDERYRAVLRTEKFLRRILFREYLTDEDYKKAWEEIWFDARACLKHYPGEFHMEDAQLLAPEVFGEWKQDEKLTRIQVIGDKGKELVEYAPEGHYYAKSVQDEGQTLKLLLREVDQ